MIDLIFWILALIVAITVHEAAHAWMADRLGDPTARLMGRLSLNPLVHYDPIGTTLLLFLVLLRALGAPVIPFGWAKPVIFDPYNLANPRRDSALISIAGPLANITTATIFAILMQTTGLIFLQNFVILNVVLAVFNLIPVHPLDGGKVLVGLLPPHEGRQLDLFLTRYGFIILILLIFPTLGGVSPISLILFPILRVILGLLGLDVF